MTCVESYCLAFASHNGLRTCIHAMRVAERWRLMTFAFLDSTYERMHAQVMYGAYSHATSLSKVFDYWTTRAAVGLTC